MNFLVGSAQSAQKVFCAGVAIGCQNNVVIVQVEQRRIGQIRQSRGGIFFHLALSRNAALHFCFCCIGGVLSHDAFTPQRTAHQVIQRGLIRAGQKALIHRSLSELVQRLAGLAEDRAIAWHHGLALLSHPGGELPALVQCNTMFGDEGLEWVCICSCCTRAVAWRSALRFGRPEIVALLLGGGHLLRILRINLGHYLGQALARGVNAHLARDSASLQSVGAPVRSAIRY